MLSASDVFLIMSWSILILRVGPPDTWQVPVFFYQPCRCVCSEMFHLSSLLSSSLLCYALIFSFFHSLEAIPWLDSIMKSTFSFFVVKWNYNISSRPADTVHLGSTYSDILTHLHGVFSVTDAQGWKSFLILFLLLTSLGIILLI